MVRKQGLARPARENLKVAVREQMLMSSSKERQGDPLRLDRQKESRASMFGTSLHNGSSLLPRYKVPDLNVLKAS